MNSDRSIEDLLHCVIFLSNNKTSVALTGAATKAIKTEILKKLDMIEEETNTVYQLPDRQNKAYYTVKNSRHWSVKFIADNNMFKAKIAETLQICMNIHQSDITYCYVPQIYS